MLFHVSYCKIHKELTALHHLLLAVSVGSVYVVRSKLIPQPVL